MKVKVKAKGKVNVMDLTRLGLKPGKFVGILILPAIRALAAP